MAPGTTFAESKDQEAATKTVVRDDPSTLKGNLGSVASFGLCITVIMIAEGERRKDCSIGKLMIKRRNVS